MVIFNEEKQKQKIESIREEEEEEVVKLLSGKYNLPYIDLSGLTIDLDYLRLIPENLSREGKIVVFQGLGKKIQLGLKNPELPLAKNIINELKEKYELQIFLVSKKSLEKTQEKYKEVPEFIETSKGTVDISPERISDFLNQINNLEKLKELFLKRIASGENRRVSELLEIMLSGALAMEASDIHLETQEKDVKIRLRLDGVLHDILTFDRKAYNLLLSRIKLVSEMKLNIKERAQDGRFSIKMGGRQEIEIRSSSLPGPYGETIVLRVLNPKTIAVNFEDLGMHPSVQQTIEKEISKPNGMILTTGPTGSGKTTTLYAFLKKIKSPEVKIITIEEPVEYHLAGISQTQTNTEKGYDFATGLRSILRQDPDIIMVGEIRDIEAASVALNAALTGHLVFSTLHTNDASGTIPRLIDLGASPTIIAPALNISIAQRLVRKLCNDCKKEYSPGAEEKKMLGKILDTFPKNIAKPSLKNIKLFKEKGCPKCSQIGYKGRIGIFEAILVDEEIEKMIFENPSSIKIKEASAKQNILNMQQDAVLKIINGITSIAEAKRVIEL